MSLNDTARSALEQLAERTDADVARLDRQISEARTGLLLLEHRRAVSARMSEELRAALEADSAERAAEAEAEHERQMEADVARHEQALAAREDLP